MNIEIPWVVGQLQTKFPDISFRWMLGGILVTYQKHQEWWKIPSIPEQQIDILSNRAKGLYGTEKTL